MRINHIVCFGRSNRIRCVRRLIIRRLCRRIIDMCMRNRATRCIRNIVSTRTCAITTMCVCVGISMCGDIVIALRV